VKTQGALGADDQPYTLDTITIPFENPYKSWMRIGGMDLFKDGKSAAISTWSGDVWIVTGIDAKLENLQWKRYATGLFQALGLKIVDDKIYVLGRDQITRLHDLNGDNEADWYESFNNDVQVTPGFHEFAFDLNRDSKGNFYFTKSGPVNPAAAGGARWASTTAASSRSRATDRSSKSTPRRSRTERNGCRSGDVITVGDNQARGCRLATCIS
jgi:glucose/arabinose dehydrogenase